MQQLPPESEFGIQTASLFALDSLTNAVDFGFHFWMGRVLIPADFAVLQTLNSLALVYVTASGVFQPAVSRFIAEARSTGQGSSAAGIFQSFFRAALILGLSVAVLIYIASNQLAQLLNLPSWTIQLSALAIFFSTLRPVAAGVLQGEQRFVRLGLTRLATAVARFLLAVILVDRSFTLTGAVIAFPFGWFVGVAAALFFIGRVYWKKTEQAPVHLLRRGLLLSVHALLAYTAFMSLTSLDLIWVNRSLPADQAAAYASLVLLRRVVALLPGVAVVVMFPRVVGALAAGRRADAELIRAAAIVITASGMLAAFYFAFADRLISIIFGCAYLSAARLLGWMAVGMLGVSLSSIWLNYFLAERPGTYVIFLLCAAALQWFLLTQLSPSTQNAALAFGLTGWLLAISGLLLYLYRSRAHA